MPAVNDVGEPGAREPHARFDGRELETERLVRVTEVGQPDGKPRASRLLDLPPKPRHRASSRPYTGKVIAPILDAVGRQMLDCVLVEMPTGLDGGGSSEE